MIICDKCEAPYHKACAETSGGSMMHNGPWFCPSCRGIIAMYGPQDISYDYHLMDYLWAGHLPEDVDEAERV